MNRSHLLPYLALASAFAAACVVDVNGLATTPTAAKMDGSTPVADSGPVATPDSTTTPPDSGALSVAPANTHACGWEKTFFKKVNRSTATMGNSVVRYDSFGNGAIVADDSQSMVFDHVIGAGSNYVVATAQMYVGAGVLPVIAIVSLSTGNITTSTFGAGGTSDIISEVHDASGDLLFVVSLPTGGGRVQLQRVNMATGTATVLPFDASYWPAYGLPQLHVGARYISFTAGSNGITSRPLDISDSAPSNRVTPTNPAETPFLATSDTGSRALATLNHSGNIEPDVGLALWFVDPYDGVLQRKVAEVGVGGGTTSPSLDYRPMSGMLVANDREVWLIQEQVAVPPTTTTPPPVLTRLYSYTPQFGGLQPIGISDLRVDLASSSGLATYVQPCGQTSDGGVAVGVRTLPNSSERGQWLWETAGFPNLPQNRFLVNAGGYGYRVAHTEPATP